MAGLAAGLFLASLLEIFHWTEFLAKAARPLARLANFGPVASSAFALAFISPAAANSLLAEKYEHEEITARELLLANLFNGLPAWLTHTPTLFLLLWPALGSLAIIYTGLTLLAAAGRSMLVLFLGRIFLAPARDFLSCGLPVREANPVASFLKAWKHFKKRLPRLIFFSAPIFLLMWICQQYGYFNLFESWLARHLEWLSFLKPQAMSIIALQFLAEMGATLGAASAALQDGSLTSHDVVLAMLAGNILATPMRAIRHQLPAYAGFFKPAMAVRLVLVNQALRAASMILVTFLYWIWI